MKKLSEGQLEELREMAKRYDLKGWHFHKDSRGFVIITREGIERIAAHLKVRVKFTPVLEWCDPDKNKYVVQAEAWIGDNGSQMYSQSYGEVSEKNNKNAYPVAMAEKRALSRVVLKLAGMYELGVYGEDELPTEAPKS
jgi:hypothetical protein